MTQDVFRLAQLSLERELFGDNTRLELQRAQLAAPALGPWMALDGGCSPGPKGEAPAGRVRTFGTRRQRSGVLRLSQAPGGERMCIRRQHPFAQT